VYEVGSDAPRRNRRQAAALTVGWAAGPSIIVWLALLFVLGPLLALIPTVVVLIALATWQERRASERILARVAAKPADPEAHARLHNLVDNLCVTGGLAKPGLLIASMTAVNAMPLGRSARQAHLVVTEGALDRLSRIELEGLLAQSLVRIRSNDVAPATAAVSAFGPMAGFGPVGRLLSRLTVERLPGADLAAIGLTRYPPGLAGALGRAADGADPVPALGGGLDLLWAVPAGSSAQVRARLQALEEL